MTLGLLRKCTAGQLNPVGRYSRVHAEASAACS
jgi:hypothetical protein